MDKKSKVLVAGHRGLVGSAILRRLISEGYQNVVKVDLGELDLRNQAAVDRLFDEEQPEYVFLAAAKVGGILANNTYPAEFIRDNLLIQTLVIDAAWRNKVKRFLFLGSSCIYPKFSKQPMKEEYLLTGELEPTNEPYAIAKIAGLKMCQAYLKQYGMDSICLMPTNLYGPGDNFDLENSHVLPALIRKMHEAKIKGLLEVVIWGTGTPRREFLYVDDLAEAAVFLMNGDKEQLNSVASDRLINVGVGTDIEIRELALLIRDIIYPEAELIFDITKPDGTPRKLLDITRLNKLGWKAKVGLKEGIEATYDRYKN